MPRLFLSFSRLPHDTGRIFHLNPDESRYVSSVLRMRRGGRIVVADADGLEVETEIVEVRKGVVSLEVVGEVTRRQEPRSGIVLMQGMLKGSRMDLVVQKATELGVRMIVPVITERSQVRNTRKAERWRKVALEAARQCGRPSLPAIEGLVALDAAIGSIPADAQRIVFWEEESSSGLRPEDIQPQGDVCVLVGPEGGLAEHEVSLARDAGFMVRGLGPNVLRAETAAIAAVTLLQYLSGRLG